jgi:hypothetical protein
MGVTVDPASDKACPTAATMGAGGLAPEVRTCRRGELRRRHGGLQALCTELACAQMQRTAVVL